jgi:predicted nucleic acid-binding protein
MVPLVRAWDLGPGESAVLEWAQANRPARAIIDDYAARKLATVLSVQVTGTLGLALLAKQRGIVPVAKPLVEEFSRAGLYLSESVVQRALRLVGE